MKRTFTVKPVLAAYPQDMLSRISDAKNALNGYDPENVEYVKECRDEILKEISRQYGEEVDTIDQPLGATLSEIKRDYMLGAVEDGMMDEDEFEDIFNILDELALEHSASYM